MSSQIRIPGFVKTPEYKDEFIKQHQQISNAFNFGDLTGIMYTVDHYDAMCDIVNFTGKDNEYEKDMEVIEAWRETEYKKKIAIYEAEIREASCPDVVNLPDKRPPKQYFQMKYIAINRLLQRRDFLLKEKKEMHF